MSIRVGIGSGLVTTLAPRDVLSWAEASDDWGVDSLWVSDQSSGGSIEPLMMLTALAARTRRVRLGTNVLVISMREPVLLARQLASLHALSGGRVVPAYGVGAGTNPFWAAGGIDPATRGKRADEAIVLVRDLLTEDRVAFEGRFYRYAGAGVEPRPRVPLPCWIGGDSEAAIRRTAALGDGWIGGLSTPERVGRTISRIKASLSEHGRSIDADHYGATIPFRIGREGDPAVHSARAQWSTRVSGATGRTSTTDGLAIGPAHHVVDVIGRYIARGASKFVALPIANDAEDVMDQTRRLVEQVIPQIERDPLADMA